MRNYVTNASFQVALPFAAMALAYLDTLVSLIGECDQIRGENTGCNNRFYIAFLHYCCTFGCYLIQYTKSLLFLKLQIPS